MAYVASPERSQKAKEIGNHIKEKFRKAVSATPEGKLVKQQCKELCETVYPFLDIGLGKDERTDYEQEVWSVVKGLWNNDMALKGDREISMDIFMEILVSECMLDSSGFYQNIKI